ncbi:hypothetical protein P175DRAFT_0150140 [Aspergillus ochraceoroseus IBT 24754]|uniref:Fe2OG dioxygenase domain-containing protein n=2 Tax=Aspergillus ochraceoroseus TaxID=138278 RepID=A0A2T5M301_9EURO|nr:uncharacterized protein P175DRAFT_0150140 [Aspergillus ochraceoroseus IBT 24754]KKK20819.1 hypothetical protein AOCH_005811 [Aspergillus ochraceoroseus]PTU22920.1 hypothetical protein P175DRAFT_0150140 [Aspergillus ochraceoroseus IBT 24754]
MDRYLSRKRPRSQPASIADDDDGDDDTSTDIKLAQLVSLFVEIPQDILLDILVSSGGSVQAAISTLTTQQHDGITRTGKRSASTIQTSLSAHILRSPKDPESSTPKKKEKEKTTRPPPPLIQKGKTLHLFAPEDIASHTPCTIIHNFLPAHEANALLLELLDESPHFSRYRFQLFDRTVQSPHSTSVYVSTPHDYNSHAQDYTYGGTYRSNVREATPHLRAVSARVQQAVNEHIQARIRDVYPDGKKLKYQSPRAWVPNAAFVNCYDGPAESVGYHSDELTYLGPRPVIGSLSLGVQREFRVRRIVPREEDPGVEGGDAGAGAGDDDDDDDREEATAGGGSAAEMRGHSQGQISIALPHNSLLIMHADMQEEWKHAIVPAQTITPHSLAGNRRINVTYRWYRDSLHPRNIPRCRCGAHAILKCPQRKRDTRGRYMWTCFMGHVPGKKGCGFFQWAEFDDDGEPLWKHPQAKNEQDENAPKLTSFAG